jgi:dethiobiotin synthetase
MTAYFMTATGTGVGKTHVTTRWISDLQAAGKPVMALKPIISGWQTENLADNDTARILNVLGLPFETETIERISPWRFKAPLSPDMAALQEGRDLDFDALILFCQKSIIAAKENNHTLLIEGVGGAFVPLGKKNLVVDWIQALQLPVILVAANYLGSLSHTLSTVYALESRKIKIQKIILNENKIGQVDLKLTQNSLAQFISYPIEIMTHRTTNSIVHTNLV